MIARRALRNPIARLGALLTSGVALLFLCVGSIVHADDDADHLDRIASDEATEEDWEWAARKISDKLLRSDIRDALLELEDFPRKPLVSLLTDEHLAIRLGALELLEEAAGDGYGFNAWASPTGDEADPGNEHALEIWRTWSGQEGDIKAVGPVLSEEQMQSYIRDVLSGDTERKKRAVRMLEPHGLKGVAEIEEFITGKPGLPENSRVNLKEAQYHLVLSRTAGENASRLARDLTRGNRDQQLGGIAALKQIGFLAIPIVRDYLGSPDALVRETAIDTILSLGGAQTVPLVAPYLEKEKDVNVIHAAMRRFREIGGLKVTQIISSYLEHEDEDLVVSAIQSIAKLQSDDESASTPEKAKLAKSNAQKIIKHLEDPRWRVRATALDYVALTTESGASDQVVAMLSDEDEFVRANAIKAAVALRLGKAGERLEKMFLTDDDMVGPASQALSAMSKPLSDKLVAHLDTRPVDVIVGAIRTLNCDQPRCLDIVVRYATHENLDVACAALRTLANDDDKLQNSVVSNHLAAALNSGDDEKITAVLDTLDLPSMQTSNSKLAHLLSNTTAPGDETSLDPLYDAFLAPLRKAAEEAEKNGGTGEGGKPAPAKGPDAKGGLKALGDALAKHASDWEKPDRAFRAALLLADADDERGMHILADHVGSLSVSQRAAIADTLYSPDGPAATILVQALLRDTVPDIREETASLALNDNNVNLVETVLKELESPDAKLTAKEAYCYNFEEAAASTSTKRVVNRWCKRVLANEQIDPEIRILALAMMRTAMNYSDTKIIEPFTMSENQWERRAAWYSLARARPTSINDRLEEFLEDESPRVREAFPWAMTGSSKWQIYFSDNSKVELSYYSSENSRSLTKVQETALRKLATGDPSPEIRFESWATLLKFSKQIDLEAFIKLLAQQPPEMEVGKRLADLIEDNYKRMGKGMKPLLAYADTKHISRSKLPGILRHFSGGKKEAATTSSFTSFAALAKATETGGEPQVIKTETVDPEKPKKERERLLVVFFHKSSCQQCEKVERHLQGMKKNFPLMEINKLSMTESDNILLNRALCDRFNINKAGKYPALFTQAGHAIASNTKPQQIGELLAETMALPDDPDWAKFGTEEIAEAEEKVSETFSDLTLPLVIGAGLLDGINPCAFATIIFFLSYLQIAKRKPREILMVGIAFILAIFITYFSVGMVFHGMVDWLNEQDSYRWVKGAMIYVFAGFALLVAILSLRDALRAWRGNLEDMTLQLPSFLKKRIRGVIRKGARARNFVLAAFISGILISFLELACTGQVYAPIIFKIQQGSADAVMMLLIYNLAFILPLVVIFILAFFGMTSDALINFQKKHTAAVKFATAILFFILAAVILFGDKWFGH